MNNIVPKYYTIAYNKNKKIQKLEGWNNTHNINIYIYQKRLNNDQRRVAMIKMLSLIQRKQSQKPEYFSWHTS